MDLQDKARMMAGVLGLSMALAFVKKPSFREITFALSGGVVCGWFLSPVIAFKIFGNSHDSLILCTAFLAVVGGIIIKAFAKWTEDNSSKLLSNVFKRYTNDDASKP